MQHKTRRARLIGRIFVAICTAPVAAFAQNANVSALDDVVAIGPVESVSQSGRDFTVLGRTFHSSDGVALYLGDYVAIHAAVKPDGTLSDARVDVLGTYVAGSDLVYEKGVVSEIQPFVGQMSIGASKIDYTASMYAGNGNAPALGDVLAVSGIQPTSHATLVVDSLMATADGVRDSLLGGGVVQRTSIQGSGIRSASIQGSGVQSASIQGSGIRSASIQGSGVQSASIQGSGIRSASIQGSGVQSASIQGSGIRSASIQGSGVQSASIQGSGIRSASIQGSGVQSASIRQRHPQCLDSG